MSLIDGASMELARVRCCAKLLRRIHKLLVSSSSRRDKMEALEPPTLRRFSVEASLDAVLDAVWNTSDDADVLHAEAVATVRLSLRALPARLLEDMWRASEKRGWGEEHSLQRVLLLRMLLRRDVPRLVCSLRAAVDSVQAQLVRALKEHGAGLTHLDLGKLVLEPVQLEALARALCALPELRLLYLHSLTDELLEAAAVHCPHLHSLAHLTTVSRRGVAALAVLPMTVLNIRGDVLAEDVALVLSQLPGLVCLGNYSSTGPAVLAMMALYPATPPTKIESFMETDTTPAGMCAATRMCPEVRSLVLLLPHNGVVPQLAKFVHLWHLRLGYFCAHEVLEMLEAAQASESGPRFRVLSLMLQRDTVPLDLARVAELCPTLQELGCLDVNAANLATAVWSALVRIDVKPAHGGCLEDEDVAGLCAGAGGRLVRVMLRGARDKPLPLTAATLRLVVDTCPALEMLGDMLHWAVTEEEVEAVRARCRDDQRNVHLLFNEDAEDADPGGEGEGGAGLHDEDDEDDADD